MAVQQPPAITVHEKGYADGVSVRLHELFTQKAYGQQGLAPPAQMVPASGKSFAELSAHFTEWVAKQPGINSMKMGGRTVLEATHAETLTSTLYSLRSLVGDDAGAFLDKPANARLKESVIANIRDPQATPYSEVAKVAEEMYPNGSPPPSQEQSAVSSFEGLQAEEQKKFEQQTSAPTSAPTPADQKNSAPRLSTEEMRALYLPHMPKKADIIENAQKVLDVVTRPQGIDPKQQEELIVQFGPAFPIFARYMAMVVGRDPTGQRMTKDDAMEQIKQASAYRSPIEEMYAATGMAPVMQDATSGNQTTVELGDGTKRGLWIERGKDNAAHYVLKPLEASSPRFNEAADYKAGQENMPKEIDAGFARLLGNEKAALEAERFVFHPPTSALTAAVPPLTKLTPAPAFVPPPVQPQAPRAQAAPLAASQTQPQGLAAPKGMTEVPFTPPAQPQGLAAPKGMTEVPFTPPAQPQGLAPPKGMTEMAREAAAIQPAAGGARLSPEVMQELKLPPMPEKALIHATALKVLDVITRPEGIDPQQRAQLISQFYEAHKPYVRTLELAAGIGLRMGQTPNKQGAIADINYEVEKGSLRKGPLEQMYDVIGMAPVLRGGKPVTVEMHDGSQRALWVQRGEKGDADYVLKTPQELAATFDTTLKSFNPNAPDAHTALTHFQEAVQALPERLKEGQTFREGAGYQPVEVKAALLRLRGLDPNVEKLAETVENSVSHAATAQLPMGMR